MLQRVLDPWTGAVDPDSPAEARLFRQLVAWDFPAPELQIPVLDGHGRVVARLDAGWSDRRIGLEYDSSRWHNPATWDDDEIRHHLITSLGWELFRIDRLDLLSGNPGLRNRLRSAWNRQPSTRSPLGLARRQSA